MLKVTYKYWKCCVSQSCPELVDEALRSPDLQVLLLLSQCGTVTKAPRCFVLPIFRMVWKCCVIVVR